jgi:hypothetical protein
MTAIQRTPAPTPSAALPSCTSEKAKTRTHDTAKNNVVYAISRLLTSTVRSLRTISQTARNIVTGRKHEGGNLLRRIPDTRNLLLSLNHEHTNLEQNLNVNED